MQSLTPNSPEVLSASTIMSDKVVNAKGEDLGKIEDLMIDLSRGRISYVVLSFGGFLGIGDKLFAIPWEALTLDAENKRFILNVDKERLEKAPGFNKDNWPKAPVNEWLVDVYTFYGYQPYWTDDR